MPCQIGWNENLLGGCKLGLFVLGKWNTPHSPYMNFKMDFFFVPLWSGDYLIINEIMKPKSTRAQERKMKSQILHTKDKFIIVTFV